MLATRIREPERAIIQRTTGRRHGAITRLVSPSDLGGLIKPFVFLDLAVFDGSIAPTPMEYFWHPHSGIGTVTVMLEGAMQYAETTGKAGVVGAGGVEWMRAGNGVWHTGAPEPGRVALFQLWVALPPELENGPHASHYVMPNDVPVVGPARIILGEYGGAKSPIDAPPLTYLSVSLEAGERWSYQPPPGHTLAWVAVHEGVLHTSSPIVTGEVAIFEPSEQAVDFVAEGKTGFVLGSAKQHPYDLVVGSYSVHTSHRALEQGEAEIRRIGRTLRDNGMLKR